MVDASNGYQWVERRLSMASSPPRSARPPRHTLIASAGVVVVLLGAIAIAGRSSSGSGPVSPPAATADATATSAASVPSERGAAGTAARYAATLGGESMFTPEARRAIVDAIAAPGRRGELQAALDADYTAAFNERIGLDANGRPPQGSVFVSRTMPAGTTVTAYNGDTATVDVWSSGLFGVTGKASKAPITTNWFTMTIKLTWSADGWKLAEFTQTDGPEPTSRGDFGQAPAW